MTTETATEERAKRDGCECPPWVTQCLHYDGKLLVVAKPQGRGCQVAVKAPKNRSNVVALILEPYRPCPCGCGATVTARAQILFRGTRDEMPAAFALAEARLLGRADE